MKCYKYIKCSVLKAGNRCSDGPITSTSDIPDSFGKALGEHPSCAWSHEGFQVWWCSFALVSFQIFVFTGISFLQIMRVWWLFPPASFFSVKSLALLLPYDGGEARLLPWLPRISTAPKWTLRLGSCLPLPAYFSVHIIYFVGPGLVWIELGRRTSSWVLTTCTPSGRRLRRGWTQGHFKCKYFHQSYVTMKEF